jgi:hypothetical protein
MILDTHSRPLRRPLGFVTRDHVSDVGEHDAVTSVQYLPPAEEGEEGRDLAAPRFLARTRHDH